jgi:hypothetical protein
MGWHNSISYTVARAIRSALTPRYGGEIVEQVSLVDGAEAPTSYRWKDGWVIEVAQYSVMISRIDTPTIVERSIDIEDVSRAGEEWADETEIRRRADRDLAEKPPTADELATAFAGAETLGNLLTGAARRSYAAVAGSDEASERLLTSAEIEALALCAEAV